MSLYTNNGLFWCIVYLSYIFGVYKLAVAILATGFWNPVARRGFREPLATGPPLISHTV